MKQLFHDGDIEVMERKETTIGEQLKAKAEQAHRASEANKQEDHETTSEVEENAVEKPQEKKKAISYTVSEDVDTRDNSKIYVVKLSEKVSREEYQTINNQIKNIGGYYSRFKKGFLFKNDPTEQLKTIFGTGEPIVESIKNNTIEPKEIESHYYPINEQDAKTSRSFWSMFDYVPNSETNGYKRSVDEVYTMVKQIAKTRPQYLSRALLLADRYAKKFAEWINKGYRIDMMCPSVLITGGSNFPVRKKEKQNRSQDKHMEEYQYIKAIPDQIQDLLSGYHKDVIKSSDSDAIEQLKSKLKKLQAEREQIKTENKQLKAKGESIHAPYILQNLGQNIRNVEQRIEQLEKTKAKPTSDVTKQYNTTVCKVVENTEIMRLQLLFDGKPNDEIRSILKSHAFKWSPSNEAWQRQLTNNAKYETKSLLKEIETHKQQEEQTA